MARFHTLLFRFAAILLTAANLNPAAAAAPNDTYTADGSQHRTPVLLRNSGSLATLVEMSVARYGSRTLLHGEEGSGAIIGCLRYGYGALHQAEGSNRLLQGPSIGGISARRNRTMMLVYDLPNSIAIYRRYGGVNGSAYLVGGLGMTVLANTAIPDRTVYVVPIRSGVGVRLGMNVGYLKFTPRPTWNPF